MSQKFQQNLMFQYIDRAKNNFIKMQRIYYFLRYFTILKFGEGGGSVIQKMSYF